MHMPQIESAMVDALSLVRILIFCHEEMDEPEYIAYRSDLTGLMHMIRDCLTSMGPALQSPHPS